MFEKTELPTSNNAIVLMLEKVSHDLLTTDPDNVRLHDETHQLQQGIWRFIEAATRQLSYGKSENVTN